MCLEIYSSWSYDIWKCYFREEVFYKSSVKVLTVLTGSTVTSDFLPKFKHPTLTATVLFIVFPDGQKCKICNFRKSVMQIRTKGHNKYKYFMTLSWWLIGGNILEGLSKLAAAAMIKQSLKVMSRWSTEFRYWQGLENIQLNIPWK